MKLIKNFFTICMVASVLASCNFMNCDESDDYTLNEIQGSYNRVKQFVTNIYGYLPSDFCSIDGAMQDAATDDAIHVYETSNIQRFVNGTWSANNTIDDKFAQYYNGIHDANYYLENMLGLDFKDWEYGDDYEYWMQNYANYEYEVRFLRAYFYFELMKEYGPVVLAPEKGWPLDTPMDELLVPRNSWDECVNFVVNELKLAVENLPETQLVQS